MREDTTEEVRDYQDKSGGNEEECCELYGEYCYPCDNEDQSA